MHRLILHTVQLASIVIIMLYFAFNGPYILGILSCIAFGNIVPDFLVSLKEYNDDADNRKITWPNLKRTYPSEDTEEVEEK